MPLKELPLVWQALALGIIAGMRSIMAPAVASHILSKRTSGYLAKSSLDFMQTERSAVILNIMAASELIADKLPFTPNRTESLSVTFRCLSGSLAGASIFKAKGGSMRTGALLGSVAALGSTFGCYYLRKIAVEKFKLPDPLIGGIEDILTIGGGLILAAKS